LDALYRGLTAASIAVIIGVILEGAELVSEYRKNGWKPIWPKIGFCLLVIGLVGELFFQTKIESADSELKLQSDRDIITAQTAASIANERAGNAIRDAARANGQTEILRKQNLDLEAALAPRGLEQLKSSQALKPFSGIPVFIASIPDVEARRLADMMAVMFDMAGWSHQRLPLSKDDIPDGVEVRYLRVRPSIVTNIEEQKSIYEKNDRIRLAADAIVEQLRNNKIVAQASFIPSNYADMMWPTDAPKDAIVIFVGFKPTQYFSDKRIEELKSSGEKQIIMNNR
jgi:hypothetical protein